MVVIQSKNAKGVTVTQVTEAAVNLLLNVGTDVLADQLEQADTRNWFLLPGSIQMARIPVKPGKHSLRVDALDGAGGSLGTKAFADIEVKAGEKEVRLRPFPQIARQRHPTIPRPYAASRS